MKSTYPSMLASLLITGSFLGYAAQTNADTPTTISSPDGRIKAEVSATNGALKYRIIVDGKQVLAPPRLGIEADNVEHGTDTTLGASTSRKIDERYRFFGAHAEAVNLTDEATISAKSRGESYFVDVYVANDGVGVRLWLPAKVARKVQADRSTWMLEGDPTIWAGKLDNSCESPDHTTTLKQLGTDGSVCPLPLASGSSISPSPKLW